MKRPTAILGVLVLLGARTARADEAGVCADAAEKAQRVRDKGQFVEAKELFTTCARSQCPKLVRDDCVGFLDQLRRRMPSLVFRVTDGSGHDLTDFRVIRGGKPLLERPSGTAVDTDPGAATLRIEAPGYAPRELQVVVAEGEQRRLVEVVMKPAGAPTTPPPAVEKTPSSTAPGVATWIAGGIGVAGLAEFAVMQAVAWSSYADVKNQCGDAGTCKDPDLDPLRAKYTASAIGLGVGIAGVGTALVLYLAGDRRAKPAPSALRSPLVVHF